MAGEIERRDLAAARWIARSLPRGVAMANVATSIEYLTGHRNMNLHGVSSPAFLGTRAGEREAGMLEGLARLAPSDRPPYLITTTASQEASPLLREIVDGTPLFRTTSFSDEIEVYRMRYAVFDSTGRLHAASAGAAVAGRAEIDRLNVCDPVDEAAHDYAFHSALGNLRLHGTAAVARYAGEAGDAVADSGRAIIGGETFAVRTTPGRDLVIVMRTAQVVPVAVMRPGASGTEPLQFVEADIAVLADDHPAARVRFRPAAEGWDEAVVVVPGNAITRDRTSLKLSGRYAAYRYWFFQ
jgi:hypothetical protein